MLPSSLRVGWGVLSLSCVGCFVDAVGLPPAGGGPTQGGGSTINGFTGGEAQGASGAGISTAGRDEGGAGGAPPPFCGDGTVVTGEACEDGNRDPGDGCNDCEFEQTCGNNAIEPTEECDPPSADCTAECKAEATTGCAMAVGYQGPSTNESVDSRAADNPFIIPLLSGELTGGCDVNDALIPTNVYRIQVGPYPEGVFLKAKGGSNTDPVLSVYKGCGESAAAGLFCNHADTAMVVTDVVPAGSVMFATVGDRGDGGDFEFWLWFHRFWATFDTSSDWLIDPASWIQGVSEMNIANVSDTDGGAMASPPVFVGNLGSFEVVLNYGFDKAAVNLAVSFDDGASWEQEVPLDNASWDDPKWKRKSFDNPTFAQFAKVRLDYVTLDASGRARVTALRVQPFAPFNTW